jgi:predicted aldo/keto reductase-like oxidoreductase
MGKGGWKRDADAEYLYNKLEKAGIQAVVMEPLLGGRLANVPEEFAKQLKEQRPNSSVASWAFRWVGTLPNILTTLSGMSVMDHVKDNVNTFSPLDPCTEQEKALLSQIADGMSGYPTIPCTACSYCMPCPFGVNIPQNFSYYNEAVNKKLLPLPDKSAADYSKRLTEFKEGYKKAIDEAAWANKCMDCEVCLKKCPQQIRIPNQMARIVELLK